MAKKILLFEFSKSHSEFLYSQVLFLTAHGYDVHLWISQDSHFNLPDSVKLADLHKFSAGKNGSLSMFSKLREYIGCHGIQKMIINTAHGKLVRNLALFFLFHPVEMIGVLHFGEKIGRSFTQCLISLKIRKYFTLNDYIVANLHESASKYRFCVFFYLWFSDQFCQKTVRDDGQLRIVIPGAIDFARRDYFGLFEQIAQCAEKIENISFSFLGDCSSTEGKKLQSKAQELGIDHCCRFFTGFVPQDVFYRTIASADLIMPLIHPNTREYEAFTRFSISGAFNLAFGFKIPLLLYSDRYNEYEIFKETAFFYLLEDLPELLVKLRDNRQLIEEHAERYNSFDQLTFDYQSVNYVRFIESNA